MQRSVTVGVAAVALAALGWFVSGPGWAAATGPAGLALPVFVAIALAVAVADHRSRRRAPARVYARGPVSVPSQRVAATADTSSTGPMTGVVSRR